MNSHFLLHAQYNISQAIEKMLLDALQDITGGTLSFVQVGANDGQMNDPLSSRIKTQNWHGILFEPVTSYFDKLVKFHGDNPRLKFIQGACGDRIDVLEFYEVLDTESLPHTWMKGLSSFRHDVIRKHFTSDEEFNKHVRRSIVGIKPLGDYLLENNITSCDLLAVDTEGFELEVLKGFDAAKYKTNLVIIEHEHLNLDTRRKCVELMRGYGLTPAIGYFDIYFFRREAFGDAITKLLHPFAEGICAHRDGF